MLYNLSTAMKKQTKIILVTIGLVGFAGVAYAWTLWPQKIAKTPAIAPTKQIDTTTSIGGTIATKDTPTSQRPADTATPSPSISPSNTNTATPTGDPAPKQTEIKKTITKEYPYRALGTSNDPLTQNSWALTNTKAQAAWDQSTGNNVVVAVIDTGFALQHEDLVNQWRISPGETGMTKQGDRCWTGASADKAANACDDDNNGYVDDWRGWNFAQVNNNPQAGTKNPNGIAVAHGTEVAGLVGATGNNSKGIATYAWNTRIIPLQVLDDDGSGFSSSVAAAVYYAVDNGASVINMSLGGDTADPALDKAINYAYARNVIVVAAAGNCGTGQEYGCDPSKPGAMGYPALNDHVISVGATTNSNTRASFSSYGPGLDVVAPGSGTITSPMWTASNPTSAYAGSLYGTSFASPLVASYVALIKSVRPSTNVDDITALVDGSAQKVTAMNNAVYTNEYGHGLINAQAALSIGSSLNQASNVPTLQQTGSHISEHTYRADTTLSSGCTATAAAYCTVWARDSNGYDRYLPYSPTPTGSAGWSWNGTALGSGEWWLRARSGENVSNTPYLLFQK
jgi:subtilisin family serine protease